ncbi:MAG: uroporphyrinogen decarboxylase/cobalamine-independent methonine synthase family protein [Thermoplasmatota archaeon]
MPISYLGGIAARSERYMRDHWGAAKGFVTPAALLASARQEETDHVALQQAAGLDLVSPALTRWEDLLRPLLRDGTGATVGQLTRYFETNTFFRQPLVSGAVAAAAPASWFEAFALPKGTPWVLTLPSPYDFAVRAKDERKGSSVARLAKEAGQTLRPVVEAAVKQGAAIIRFHDPSIAYGRSPKPDVDAFAEGLAAAAKGHEEISTLHITNGDPFAVPAALQANPLGGLSIEDPGRAPPAKLSLPNRTRLTVAVIRGEDSLVEKPREAADNAVALADRLGVELFGITNGWDLDHVPHAIAVRKVQALGQTRKVLAEVLA